MCCIIPVQHCMLNILIAGSLKCNYYDLVINLAYSKSQSLNKLRFL
jgi:hypothetical protein